MKKGSAVLKLKSATWRWNEPERALRPSSKAGLCHLVSSGRSITSHMSLFHLHSSCTIRSAIYSREDVHDLILSSISGRVLPLY